jgi:hypothetical protein
MSWGAQNRSKDAKTPSVAGVRSRKPKLELCGIQPYGAWAKRGGGMVYDDVQRNMATIRAHKGGKIFGNRQGRPATYNHAVSNVTALNAMHQRPDAPPLRAWCAELHAQQALAAIASGHGLPKGRLVATEI